MTMLLTLNLYAKQRGISVKAKSGESLYLYKDYHALVVGVGDYDFWPDLQGAVKDAKEVAEHLKKAGMKVKLISNPTSKQLKRSLNQLTYSEGKEKNRGILFFYSGHGETESLATGEKLGYIVPKDCPTITQDYMGFTEKAISMNQIETYALRIKSKHVLMVFDSCFSGSIFSSLKGVPRDITEKSNRPVRQFITAGNEDEQVPDDSIFKTCFVQGIDGEADYNKDGYVTGSELGMYLDASVVNYTKGSQHPQYGKIRHPKLDKGDFIFHLDKVQAAATPPSLPIPHTSNVIGSDSTYIAYANGIVKDTNIGLEWVVGPDRDMTWDEARSWVERLKIDDGGWQMPTIKELKTLYKKGIGKRNMTPLLNTTGWTVWSKKKKDFSTSWCFSFLFGYGGWLNHSNCSSVRAFAVRVRK